MGEVLTTWWSGTVPGTRAGQDAAIRLFHLMSAVAPGYMQGLSSSICVYLFVLFLFLKQSVIID